MPVGHAFDPENEAEAGASRLGASRTEAILASRLGRSEPFSNPRS
jgi:hypothetical protein